MQDPKRKKKEDEKFEDENMQTKKRVKTNPSMKSSQGSKKPVIKIVDEYILMINKIG